MALAQFYNICPVTCTVIQLPALPADPNCNTRPVQSELSYFWVKPTAAADTPFAGWVADTASTGTVTIEVDSVDNTVTDNTKCKQLSIIGSLEAPEKIQTPGPGFTSQTIARTYTVTMEVKSIPDEMYDFLRAFQCNPKDFTFWYGSETYAYGSATGIPPTFVDVDFIHASGEESVVTANITVQFKALIDPERRNNPYS